MKSVSFSEQQHTPDITHKSTQTNKIKAILYYFQILSQRSTAKVLQVDVI